MQADRIYFKDNPWPQGHAIKQFTWSAKELAGDIWFEFYLKTVGYNADHNVDDVKDYEHPSDWVTPGTWRNYGWAKITPNSGFRVCSKAQYNIDFVDGLALEVDPNPEDFEDFSDYAFGIYLLGHDTVAKHHIKFERIGQSTQFKILWTGAIALTYDCLFDKHFNFDHSFFALISGAEFPAVSGVGE